ncbi:MAG: sigma 54-interacting transcriptional regulator [Succinivibrio sp.]|jgi:two-component system nitrogen regulation response regulator GlnG|nr:sigma 54-interacting transcriptional regulator [Succinivibrio sp.]
MNPMIWIIDDDASIRFVFDKALDVNSIRHRLFETGDAALAALEHEVPDVIVSDIRMPGIDGLSLIRAVHKVDADIPFIIMTAHSDLAAAIDSYEQGSFEYLPKPFDIEAAVTVIRRAALHRFNTQKLREERSHEQGAQAAHDPDEDEEIIGKSPVMQEVFKFIGRVSKTELPVLVQGEVGTGRELVAQALHRHGSRRDHSFVSVNMTSMPQDMVSSEVFGDVSGSQAQACAIARAAGGTLFVNEICDMPMDAQTRLLHLVQTGEYIPVGTDKPVKADVRIIASSSKDLEDMAAQGAFISDLYYRLNVINIRMPPLRERNNDIPMLAKHFLAAAAAEAHTEPKKLTSEVLVFLCRQNWPGNVTQLKNLCKYLTIMVTGNDIQLVDLPSEFLHSRPQVSKGTTSISGSTKEATSWQEQLRNWVDSRLRAGERDILSEAVPEFERVMLEATLSFTGNHKQESAKLLGWGRNTLTRKIKELNLK